jgi:hypothetical protein
VLSLATGLPQGLINWWLIPPSRHKPRVNTPRNPHIAGQATFHLNPAYALRNLADNQRYVHHLVLRLEQQKLHGAVDSRLLAW